MLVVWSILDKGGWTQNMNKVCSFSPQTWCLEEAESGWLSELLHSLAQPRLPNLSTTALPNRAASSDWRQMVRLVLGSTQRPSNTLAEKRVLFPVTLFQVLNDVLQVPHACGWYEITPPPPAPGQDTGKQRQLNSFYLSFLRRSWLHAER